MAFLTGPAISPFSIANALLHSTEKSPVIGLAVWAPKTLVVRNPESISEISILFLKSKMTFDEPTEGIQA